MFLFCEQCDECFEWEKKNPKSADVKICCSSFKDFKFQGLFFKETVITVGNEIRAQVLFWKFWNKRIEFICRRKIMCIQMYRLHFVCVSELKITQNMLLWWIVKGNPHFFTTAAFYLLFRPNIFTNGIYYLGKPFAC